MRLKSAILVWSLAHVLGAIGCTSSAPPPNAQSPPAGSPQAVEKSDASTGGNREGSKDGVIPQPDETRTEVKTTNVRYKVNAGQSHFTAQVFAGGLLSALGHDHAISIGGVIGEVQLTPETIEPAALQMTMKANTAVETGKEFSEKDRQGIDRSVREEALEAAKYPEILFESTQVSATRTGAGQYQAKIAGQLTLHGVTRPITIPAQVTLSGDTLRARGEFLIKHSDYNIKRLSAAGGMVKAQDEMKLSFDIVANKY